MGTENLTASEGPVSVWVGWEKNLGIRKIRGKGNIEIVK